MAKVSIIVLQYNKSDLTLACLESLRALDANIIVVDNHSEVEHVKTVEYWIESRKITNYELLITNENLGYSGGNNIGIKYALEHGAEYVLILNNDTVVEPDFLERMLEVQADIVGVEEGIVFGFYYLSGVALLIRRDAFAKIGLFDERYFLYYEDVEYSRRAQKAGLKLATSSAKLLHATSSTSSSLGPATLLYYHTRNALLLRNFRLPIGKFWNKLKQHIKIAFGRDVEISKAILQAIQDYDHHRFGMRVQ